eukprot:COSAG02_NODE_67_length_42609_cov_14.506681_25_plen_105_part_00
MDRRLSEKNVKAAQNGNALQFASGSLQQDKQVELVAVAQDGNVLQFAPESLQDKQVVLEAVAQDGNAPQFAIRVATAGPAPCRKFLIPPATPKILRPMRLANDD